LAARWSATSQRANKWKNAHTGQTCPVRASVPPLPFVVMAADSIDDSHREGLAALAACHQCLWRRCGASFSKTRRAILGLCHFGGARDGCAGSRAKHAACVVAAAELIRTAGLAAIFRFSELGPLLVLPAGAAGLGLRSIRQLRSVRSGCWVFSAFRGLSGRFRGTSA
jgi:hypothetical protein